MASQQKKITVLIADDHEMTRQGIHGFLEQAPDIKVIGEAHDGDETKRLIEDLGPRILLLDLMMPNLTPAELERWVRTNYPETITLVLTAHDRDAYLSSMMEAGAAGYLDKKLRAGQLISAIRRAARGEFLFDKDQIERAHRRREGISQKWESLSDREHEVLQMLTEGADNKAIASSLGIKVSTVEKHLENIYRKPGITSRTEAILNMVTFCAFNLPLRSPRARRKCVFLAFFAGCAVQFRRFSKPQFVTVPSISAGGLKKVRNFRN